MSSEKPIGVTFKTVTYDPCAPHPSYVNEAHATAVATNALDWLLTKQANECERQANPTQFAPLDPHEPEALLADLLSLLDIAWTDTRHRNYIKDNEAARRAALVVPYWAAAMPFLSEKAAARRIPIIITTWLGFAFEEAPETPTGRILAVVSHDHMPPSLAIQNYRVDAVYPFATAQSTESTP